MVVALHMRRRISVAMAGGPFRWGRPSLDALMLQVERDDAVQDFAICGQLVAQSRNCANRWLTCHRENVVPCTCFAYAKPAEPRIRDRFTRHTMMVVERYWWLWTGEAKRTFNGRNARSVATAFIGQASETC
jgi:hypothetical protein